MIKINPSIRQWILSFLAVDLLIWLLFLWGCVADADSCWESFSFSPLFMYPLTTLPLVVLPAVGTLLGSLGVIPTTIIANSVGILSHVLLGALVGFALRKTKIAWFVSIAVAIVVTFGISFGVAYYNFKSEQARESKPPVVTRQEMTWVDWETYSDPQGRFDFHFAPGMAVTDAQEPYGRLSTESVAVAYKTSEASYHPMNYSQDSWFVVSSQAIDETACYAPVGGVYLTFADQQTIGATTFKIASTTDAGAGNRYEQTVYRTYLSGTCWEIATTLHYASDFTDIDESAMNASQATARTELSDMVSTFRFNL